MGIGSRAVFVAVTIDTCSLGSQNEPGLFIETTPPGATRTQHAAVLRQRSVRIDLARLRQTLPQTLGGTASTRTLPLNLFPDVQLTAILERVDPTATGYVWVGQIQGADFTMVKLAVTDDVMTAGISSAETAYEITYAGDGVHVVQQVDRDAFAPELPPVRVADTPGVAREYSVRGVDDGSQIDVLVLYTPAARERRGGTSAMRTFIDFAMSDANTALANSGAIPRLRLVHAEEVPYVESGSIFDDLARLQGSADGYMDEVHALRDAYRADLVHLISTADCGVSFMPKSSDGGFASSLAFGISGDTCLSIYSFAHELGHSMGLDHDLYVTIPTWTEYPYSHGYVNQAAFAVGAPATKRWRDVMAYNNQCAASGFSCTRVLFYSNPNNTLTGDPMGDASTADAVRSLNNTRVMIANFRDGSIPATSLTIDDARVSEGDAGAKTAIFNLSLSAPTATDVTVNYETVDGCATAGGATLSNSAPISFGSSGSFPYPSIVTAPAGLGTVTKVRVVLHGLSHTFLSDVDVLLVGPDSQSVLLMSDVGRDTDASNATLTFDDSAPYLPAWAAPVSGTFRPTNFDDVSDDVFPAPAPAGPRGSALATFIGANAAGDWRLFAVDDHSGDIGQIAGGWSVILNTTVGGDYTATSGTLTIPAGASSATVTVPVNGDTAIEASETFTVKLSNPSGATLTRTQAIGTIRNDDFTDPFLTGVTVKAAHLTELRTLINELRTAKGLMPFAFTDSTLTPGVTIVRAAHVGELRSALNDVYAAAGQSLPAYSDPQLVGTLIRSVHINEIRNAAINAPCGSG